MFGQATQDSPVKNRMQITGLYFGINTSYTNTVPESLAEKQPRWLNGLYVNRASLMRLNNGGYMRINGGNQLHNATS